MVAVQRDLRLPRFRHWQLHSFAGPLSFPLALQLCGHKALKTRWIFLAYTSDT